MVTGINESKTLTKDISCESKCRFDLTKCNSNQWWNNNKYWCECKKIAVCEKDYVWNPTKCICGNGKNLVSIIGWFNDYLWWSYKVRWRRNKNYFNKF